METWSLAIGTFQLNIVDIILISLVFLSAMLGAFKGFAREFASRFGFIIGVLAAILFNTLVARSIWDTFSIPVLWSSFIAFMAVFLIAYIVMLSLGNGMESLMEAIHLGWLDSLLGLILGAAEMLVVATLVIYVLNLQHIIDLNRYFMASEIYNRYILKIIEFSLSSITRVVNHV